MFPADTAPKTAGRVCTYYTSGGKLPHSVRASTKPFRRGQIAQFPEFSSADGTGEGRNFDARMHVCAPTPEVPKWRGRGENAYNTMYHYVLGASDVITYLLSIRPARPRAVPRTSRRRRSRPASCCSIACRWIFFAAGTVLFAARIHAVKGFYLVTYGLAIALTNNLVGLLNPKVCPPAKPFYHASHDACGVSFAVPLSPPRYRRVASLFRGAATSAMYDVEAPISRERRNYSSSWGLLAGLRFEHDVDWPLG